MLYLPALFVLFAYLLLHSGTVELQVFSDIYYITEQLSFRTVFSCSISKIYSCVLWNTCYWHTFVACLLEMKVSLLTFSANLFPLSVAISLGRIFWSRLSIIYITFDPFVNSLRWNSDPLVVHQLLFLYDNLFMLVLFFVFTWYPEHNFLHSSLKWVKKVDKGLCFAVK